MLYLSDELYDETKKIALGKSLKSPLLIELSKWFLRTYSVKILNIKFTKLQSSSNNSNMLYVILETADDCQKMYIGTFELNEEYQKEIAVEFQRLAIKHGFATQEQLQDLFVMYNDFSQEARTEANWKAADEVQQRVKEKFPTVWDIFTEHFGSVVFYYSDLEIAQNESSGITKLITEDYYATLKKNDELGYVTKENIWLEFDSKENLDKNYQGNLFYYAKR
jgi:hypothetical protein